jgi:hypothetical protein
MPANRVDVLDVASEVDLQKMERLMIRYPEHTIEIIYSPYILIEWEDQFGGIHISYFERQSKKDMQLVEDILNKRAVDKLICQKVIYENQNVQFPFALFKWTE